MAESLRAYQHLHFLLPDQGMREIDIAAHAEFISRVNSDAPVALDNLERLQNLQEAALATKPPRAHFLQHLHERLCGAIEDGHFDGINFDINIVNSAGVDRGKKMLRCGEQHALLHQASGVTDARNVVPL